MFKRELNGEEVYICLNISDGDYTFNFNTKYSRLADRLSGKQFNVNNGNASITVPQNGSMILVDDALAKPAVTEIKTEEPVPVQEVKTEESESDVKEEAPAPVPEAKEEVKGTPSAGIPDGRQIVIGGHYKHFKGGDYVVLNVAKDHETLEEQVIYMQIYDKPTVWVRPLKMFLEDVNDHGNIKPRFALIND